MEKCSNFPGKAAATTQRDTGFICRVLFWWTTEILAGDILQAWKAVPLPISKWTCDLPSTDLDGDFLHFWDHSDPSWRIPAYLVLDYATSTTSYIHTAERQTSGETLQGNPSTGVNSPCTSSRQRSLCSSSRSKSTKHKLHNDSVRLFLHTENGPTFSTYQVV